MSLARCIGSLALAVVVIVGGATASAWAQTTNATALGIITDAQDAVVPGATVTMTNVNTGVASTVTSSADGRYRIVGLLPGEYELLAELEGFAKYRRAGITLTIAQEATLNVKLQLASLGEDVTVSAEAPMVDVTSAKIAPVISRKELDSLPVAGRDFASLAAMVPGVAAVGSSTPSVGGQGNNSNSFMLDGVNNTAPNLGGARGSVSLESVQEFQVIANQFAAEYGQAAGGIISAITRSGTNRLQGRAFVYDTDQHFAAKNPFATTAPAPYNQLKYGGFLGGALVHDRMFYFVTDESTRERNTLVVTAPAAAPDQRSIKSPTDQHQPFVRIDTRFGSRQSAWLRYRLDKWKNSGCGSGSSGCIGGLNTYERGSNGRLTNQDLTINHNLLLGSRAVNEARVSAGYRHNQTDGEGFSNGGYTINRPTGNWGPAAATNQETKAPTYIFIENFSAFVGSHSLKFGGEIQLYRGGLYSPVNGIGTFTFRTDNPFNAADTGTYPTQFTQNLIPDYPRGYIALPDEKYVMFMQDSWRVHDRLTVNYGVRFDKDNAWKAIAKLDYNTGFHVAPRLGVAWDLTGDQKTLVRGGAGVYYDQLLLNPGLTIRRGQLWTNIIITNPGYPDPYSRVGRNVAPSRTVVSEDIDTPYTRTYTLGVKRQVGRGFAVSLDGVRTRGFDEFYSLDLNSPVNGVRPDAKWGQVGQFTSGAQTWYSALLVGVEQRVGVLQYGASYTLSKAENESDGTGNFPQDGVTLRSERGPASNSRRHQLVANVSGQLPWGIRAALILQTRSGVPFNITTGTDNNANGVTNDRPDLVNASGSMTDKATFSTAFTGRVGNLQRNAGVGPSFSTLDMRLSKVVRLGDRRDIEFLAEGFNITNKKNLGSPLGTLTSAQFGQSTAIVGNMRQIQLGVRFNFSGAK